MENNMREWLDKAKIKKLLSQKEIEHLEATYMYYFSEDEAEHRLPEEGCDIEIVTGFPLAKEYFEYLTESDWFFDRISSKKTYVSCFAECILKTHILCACQIHFGFPLWQDGELLAYREPIEEALQNMNQSCIQNDSDFAFPCFFPHYSNEYVLYPRFVLQWIYDVINEFFDIAEDQMFHLTYEEREKEELERKQEIKRIEDLLWKNRKKP